MGTIGSLAVTLQSQVSQKRAVEEAKYVAETIAYFVSEHLEKDLAGKNKSLTAVDLERLQHNITRLHALKKRDIEIIDRNGIIIADVVAADVGQHFADDEHGEVRQTLKDGIPRTFIEVSNDYPQGIRQIVVQLKNDESGEIFGVMLLEYTNLHNEIAIATQKSMMAILSITCVTSLLAVALGYFISASILQRIEELRQASLNIAQGDLDYRVEMESKDEIGDLAISFNKMANHLQESKTELVKTNQKLVSEIVERQQAETELHQALQNLRQMQAQLIQTEKMSSLGQLVAGIAHEINNPINFIYGNLVLTQGYTQDLLDIVSLYQAHFPEPGEKILAKVETIDLEYLIEDLPKMLASMKIGANRIREIVLSLRNFSRLDEAELKAVDIHEGIDSTLLILQNRLKAKSNHSEIEIIKEYGQLPLVECYAGQLNQVFMNIINNAIDALDEFNQQRSSAEIQAKPSTIRIRTEVIHGEWIAIAIADNGGGISQEIISKLFDPFFTTKPIGKGTGLGLSISYQIVTDKHYGKIWCNSAPGKETEFIVQIPIKQQLPAGKIRNKELKT
ncbi:ATP-binding protein [Dendronalium phyllosphericum]